MKQIVVNSTSNVIDADLISYDDLVIVKEHRKIIGFVVKKNNLFKISYGIDCCLERGYTCLAHLIKYSCSDYSFYVLEG